MATHHPSLSLDTQILSLPMDVLHQIFDYFRNPYLISKGRVVWRCLGYADADDIICHQTLRSSRLVCRIFHELASPLLCPVLRVRLDQESLDRVNKISQSPCIAAGVYGIQVVLHYRPKEFAADLARFTACRKIDLEVMFGRCDHYAETWYIGAYDKDDETICPLPYREYEKAMRNYVFICSAWDELLSPTEERVKDENCPEYQRILLQCHEEYQKKHEEQLRLITEGTFANSLAASMSRMINADSLGFIDKIEYIPDPYFENPTLLLSDTEELSRFLTTPHAWRTIEEWEGESKLIPAKILSDLPIAIHKAGIVLRDVNIGCFPVTNNYSMICPDSAVPLTQTWADLRAACQSICKFEFGGGSMNHRPFQPNHLPVNDQQCVDSYLSAMLCGQKLEQADLSFYAFGLNGSRDEKKGWFRIGSVLEAIEWPLMTHATIGDVSFSQSQLERCFTGLGYSLAYLYLCDVDLVSGSWAGALDILRDKVGSRALEGRCEVKFASLTGGEFEKLEEKEEVDLWNLPSPLPWDVEEPLLVTLSMKYVTGVENSENPLRGIVIDLH